MQSIEESDLHKICEKFNFSPILFSDSRKCDHISAIPYRVRPSLKCQRIPRRSVS